MFTKIGKILPESMAKTGLAPKLAKARVLAVFEERARELLPPEAAHAFRPLKLDHGTLTVACRSSSAAYALKGCEADLLAAVQEAGVEKLRFLLSPWR